MAVGRSPRDDSVRNMDPSPLGRSSQLHRVLHNQFYCSFKYYHDYDLNIYFMIVRASEQYCQ